MAHIFVIAGHGHGDSGATGGGYTEAERVRALAKKIKQYGGNNVTVGDMNRDWYADNGISTLNISKSWQIIELHMDSASASARGGHVIINSTFSPDQYDKALAKYISEVFPGRSQSIVKRSDLANPKRAAAKGYSYRLLECGFISNATDRKIFNENIDEIAKGILKCFDIKVSSSSSSTSKPSSSTSTSSEKYTLSKSTKIYMNAANAKSQKNSIGSYAAGTYYVYKKSDGMINITKTKGKAGAWINPNASSATTSTSTASKPSTSTSKTTLKVDGYWGTSTTKRLQQIFKTTVDGKVSNQFATYKAQNPGLDSGWEWESNPSGYSPLIKAIQKKVGATQDGHIGPNTIKGIQRWMGTTQDGVFSAKSPCIKKLQQWANAQ